jgi:hypothetical protein
VQIALDILNRYGFPTLVGVWALWTITRGLKELRDEHRAIREEVRQTRELLHKHVVLTAVIAKTLDVPDSARTLTAPPRTGGGHG